MPSLAVVRINPRNASRQSRPLALRVPPLTLCLVTWPRMSRSEPLGFLPIVKRKIGGAVTLQSRPIGSCQHRFEATIALFAMIGLQRDPGSISLAPRLRPSRPRRLAAVAYGQS